MRPLPDPSPRQPGAKTKALGHAADLTVVGMFALLMHLTRHWWED